MCESGYWHLFHRFADAASQQLPAQEAADEE
jgi:hypothetical protein